MQTMNQHAALAAQIARETLAPVRASTRAPNRQGDVLLRRIGDPADVRHSPTPEGGVCLAAGNHGEHRLIGDCYADLGPGKFSIGDGATALLVHTDVPNARHPAHVYGPGTWEYGIERELGLDESIQQVRD